MMLAGGDALVNLVQRVALPALGAATYLTARAAGFVGPGAVLAALLVVTLPLPMLEATTANSDVICAFFVLTAAVMGISAIRDRHGGEAAVAAMAVALAVGTKGIAIVAVPSLLIVWAAAAIGSRAPLRRLALYASFVVVAFAALGASFFVQNLQATGTPYGHANTGTGRTSGVLENTLWVDWRYIDLPGTSVGWVDLAAANLGETLLPESGPITYAVQHRIDDSAGGFGPIVPLFLFPLLLWYLIPKGVDPTRRSLAAASGLFLLIFPVLFEMNGDLLRVALSGIVLGARPSSPRLRRGARPQGQRCCWP
jgi:4-amino-4-deoxy-L-arabinose transferase-like glycosyltransferase